MGDKNGSFRFSIGAWDMTSKPINSDPFVQMITYVIKEPSAKRFCSPIVTTLLYLN